MITIRYQNPLFMSYVRFKLGAILNQFLKKLSVSLIGGCDDIGWVSE